LIVGGRDRGMAMLFTLTERKTCKQIIRKLKDRTQKAIARAINGIERQMGRGLPCRFQEQYGGQRQQVPRLRPPGAFSVWRKTRLYLLCSPVLEPGVQEQ